MNNLNYELDLLKQELNQLQTDYKNLTKQCEDQSNLTTTISLTKEKEISDIKKLLNISINDLNNKLLNKDIIIKETLNNFEN